MTVWQRFPAGRPVGLPAWLARPDRLTVGDERIVEFLSAFAHRLLRPDIARLRPELAALGFFLRPVELHRAVGRARGGAVDELRAPRGLVPHIQPATVDTLFVYSWALSALAGNRTVVRVSPRSAAAAELVLAALNDTLAGADPVVADPAAVPRRWLGTGVFPQATLGSLADLVALVRRRDQTLSCFGFDRTELLDLATALAGRGVDRIVPFGAALSFAPVWDGYDLLAEFTRLTTVSTTW
jgi:hypothetical protein